MRLNDDSKTVAAMDVLVPKVRFLIIHVYSLLSMCSDFSFHFFEYEQIDICLIFQVGELIGGSQREERLEVIQQRSENFLCLLNFFESVNLN
jgi:hypothetical protein